MWRVQYRRAPLGLLLRSGRLALGSFSQGLSAAVQHSNRSIDALTRSIRPVLPRVARKMLDDGLLHTLQEDNSPLQREIILQSYLGNCQSAEEKHEIVVSFSLLLNHQRLFENACESCLYHKSKCVCKHIERASPCHKLWVLQHHGEYGRSNNTGSLLCLVAGAERTIRGLRDQQEQLLDHVHERKDSSAILFPTGCSRTVKEYAAQRSLKLGSHEENEPLTLILLDGTSRQAKNLDRFMPGDIPRIRISKASIQSWLNPIRKQTEEHRVCTAQGKLLSFYLSDPVQIDPFKVSLILAAHLSDSGGDDTARVR